MLQALQNELAQAIAPQIWTHIDLAERHRGLLLPIQMDNSYHVYWRANALFHQWTPVSISEALALTTTLVAQEPHSGWAAAINAL